MNYHHDIFIVIHIRNKFINLLSFEVLNPFRLMILLHRNRTNINLLKTLILL